MSSSGSRRRPIPEPTNSTMLLATDVTDLLVQLNPKVPRAKVEATGRLVAALGAAASQLSREQQDYLVVHADEIVAIVIEARPARMTLTPKGPVEISHGAGLGERISRDEGLRRIHAYATPMMIEEWAGPVAGPNELQRDHGISRSTLHDWHQRGAVIGLLRGTRKHVFPTAQFVDGRPAPGIAEVMKIIKQPRAAWLWLCQPHPSGNGTAPIERLKAGIVEEVVEAAASDFGQQ
jgi:hypothetical protein